MQEIIAAFVLDGEKLNTLHAVVGMDYSKLGFQDSSILKAIGIKRQKSSLRSGSSRESSPNIVDAV